MAARRELLMTTSGVVTDIACASTKGTRELLTALLHQGEALGVNGQPGGAVPQPASLAALTTLANVAQSAAASKDADAADSSSSGENMTLGGLKRPAAAKAGNPPHKGKAQNQARYQPVTGPTSKGSKTRSKSLVTRSKLTKREAHRDSCAYGTALLEQSLLNSFYYSCFFNGFNGFPLNMSELI
jgi:hypothetical protein